LNQLRRVDQSPSSFSGKLDQSAVLALLKRCKVRPDIESGKRAKWSARFSAQHARWRAMFGTQKAGNHSGFRSSDMIDQETSASAADLQKV